jgi:hypothetical protein
MSPVWKSGAAFRVKIISVTPPPVFLILVIWNPAPITPPNGEAPTSGVGTIGDGFVVPEPAHPAFL